jgi:hypothetical protein
MVVNKTHKLSIENIVRVYMALDVSTDSWLTMKELSVYKNIIESIMNGVNLSSKRFSRSVRGDLEFLTKYPNNLVKYTDAIMKKGWLIRNGDDYVLPPALVEICSISKNIGYIDYSIKLR